MMTDSMEFYFNSELLNRLPSAVATYDYTTGDVLSLNQRFTEQFGYTLGDMPNIRNWWHHIFIDPDTSEAIKEKWERMLEEGQAETGTPDHELRGTIRCADGSRKHVDIRFAFMGRVLVAVFSDITREVQLATELEKVNTHDPVTGLLKQKVFMDLFAHQMERARRYHEPLSLILLEVLPAELPEDTAPEVREETETAVLGYIGRQIPNVIRNCDLSGRTGALELSLLLPATPPQGVQVVVKRILDRLNGAVARAGSVEQTIRIRLGIAATEDGVNTVGELQEMARLALGQTGG